MAQLSSARNNEVCAAPRLSLVAIQTSRWERPVCHRISSSVIPTGTDHRKAMICEVEGPCVETVDFTPNWA